MKTECCSWKEYDCYYHDCLSVSFIIPTATIIEHSRGSL